MIHIEGPGMPSVATRHPISRSSYLTMDLNSLPKSITELDTHTDISPQNVDILSNLRSVRMHKIANIGPSSIAFLSHLKSLVSLDIGFFSAGEFNWNMLVLPRTLTILKTAINATAPGKWVLPPKLEILHSSCFSADSVAALPNLKEWHADKYHTKYYNKLLRIGESMNSTISDSPVLSSVRLDPRDTASLSDIMRFSPFASEVACYMVRQNELEQFTSTSAPALLTRLEYETISISDLSRLIELGYAFQKDSDPTCCNFSDPTSEGTWAIETAIFRLLNLLYPCLRVRETTGSPRLQLLSSPPKELLKVFSSLPDSVTSLSLQHVVQLPADFGRMLSNSLLRLFVPDATTLDHNTPSSLPRSLTELQMSAQRLFKSSFQDLPRRLVSLELSGVKELSPAVCQALPPKLTSLTVSVQHMEPETMEALPASIQHLGIFVSNTAVFIYVTQITSVPPKLLSFSTDFPGVTYDWLLEMMPMTLTALNTPEKPAERLFKVRRFAELQKLRG
jgi:hypothetical protein